MVNPFIGLNQNEENNVAKKLGNDLFNNALNTFIYGYRASGIISKKATQIARKETNQLTSLHGVLFSVRKEGRKDMFYLTTHSTHFIYGYMASDIW